jgi:antitoxin component YwqK of YwqJK toxin-antitoxin module
LKFYIFTGFSKGMFLRKYILALLMSIVLPCLSFSQNEWAVRPKYAPWSDKDRNVMDEKGKQGVWKYYTRDRILIYKISYKDGVKHGPCTKFYSSNGVLREESIYFYGKRDSTYVTYYDNGQVCTEGNFTEGKKSGDWVTYFKSSGATKSQGKYVNNKREGEWTFYSSKGYKLSSGKYSKGVKEGDWPTYNADGKITQTVKYINGVAQLTEGVSTSKKITPKTTPKTISKTTNKKPPIKTDTTKTTRPKEN